jgi:flagellin
LGQITEGGTDYALSDLKTGEALDTTGAKTSAAVSSIDVAINQVATLRGKIGAFSKDTLQNRIDQISTSREQMLTTVSQIRDTDYAAETSASLRAEILEHATMLLLGESHRTTKTLLDLLA